MELVNAALTYKCCMFLDAKFKLATKYFISITDTSVFPHSNNNNNNITGPCIRFVSVNDRKRQKQESDLESDYVLSIDLTDVMFGQQTVAGSRAILDQGGDFTRLVNKAHVA